MRDLILSICIHLIVFICMRVGRVIAGLIRKTFTNREIDGTIHSHTENFNNKLLVDPCRSIETTKEIHKHLIKQDKLYHEIDRVSHIDLLNNDLYTGRDPSDHYNSNNSIVRIERQFGFKNILNKFKSLEKSCMASNMGVCTKPYHRDFYCDLNAVRHSGVHKDEVGSNGLVNCLTLNV